VIRDDGATVANERRAYAENVAGEFFVDSRCIDCDNCWHDWEQLLASTRLLLDYPFEWILPAHGRYGHLEWEAMRPLIAEVARSGAA